jgi:hypothetical protein
MLSAFQEQFRQAMVTMITAPEYYEVFARFLAAYEYRRQFPWLEEHQPHRKKQSGLAVALQTALAIYLVPEQLTSYEPATQPVIPLSEQDEHRPNIPATSSEWVNEFILATTATIEEGLSLERFEQRLARAAINVDAIAPDVLRQHIAGALNNYYNQRKTGLSPDPW